MTMSTPIEMGCWLSGLAKVLSMIETTLRARQAAAIAAMSTHLSVGLIGDSNQSTFVRSPITRSGCRSSSIDTNRALIE